MEQLSQDYQSERSDLEYDDLTTLVIKALLQLLANHANIANLANLLETPCPVLLTTQQIADTVLTIAREEETDIGAEHSSFESHGAYEAKAIALFKKWLGHVLRKMRFKKPDRKFRQYARTWQFSVEEVTGWAAAYAIDLPDPLSNIGKNGKNGEIGNKAEAGKLVEYEEGFV